MGFIAADGGVYKNSLLISQSGEEGKILLEIIKDTLEYTGVLYRVNTSTKINYRLNINSPQIIKDLKQYNVVENKSYNFNLNIKNNYFKSFLRGYFDGDGCVGIYERQVKQYRKNNSYKIYNEKYLRISFFGTLDFIRNCNELIPKELRGKITISKSCKNHGEIYWTYKKAKDFGRWLFKNDELPLYIKKIKFDNYINDPLNNRKQGRPKTIKNEV